jgi:hypothetical protein
VLEQTRAPDIPDDSFTINSRVTYRHESHPLSHESIPDLPTMPCTLRSRDASGIGLYPKPQCMRPRL